MSVLEFVSGSPLISASVLKTRLLSKLIGFLGPSAVIKEDNNGCSNNGCATVTLPEVINKTEFSKMVHRYPKSLYSSLTSVKSDREIVSCHLYTRISCSS